METLTDAEIESAHRRLQTDGYVVIPNAVDREGLATFAKHLSSEFQRASEQDRLFRGGGSISGHLNCFPGESSRFVLDAVIDRGIVDLIGMEAPDAVEQIRATTNYNLPNSSVQHYHADGLYTDVFVVCNIAVVDTDLQNGAIEIIPGTHKRFYKFWQYALKREYRRSKRICMKQGDVLLRLSTLWHRGMPNLTDEPRPMMSLTFGEASAPESDPFQINGGRVLFTPNWYGTNRLSQLQERAFVAMPLVYSALRFGRSLVGNKGYSSW